MNSFTPPAAYPTKIVSLNKPGENDSKSEGNEQAAIPAKTKRLRKNVKIKLPAFVAKRATNLASETGKTFAQSVVMLAEIGAGTPITFVVSPHNPHPDAQVSLKTVEEVLAKVFKALRDSKGILYRLDPGERATTVSVLYRDCLSLWSAIQKLSDDTFYTTSTLQDMRQLYPLIRKWQSMSIDLVFSLEKNKPVKQDSLDLGTVEMCVSLGLLADVLERLGAGLKEAS